MMDGLSSMSTSTTNKLGSTKPISPVSATEPPTRTLTPDKPDGTDKAIRQPNLSEGPGESVKARVRDTAKGAGFTIEGGPDSSNKIIKPSVIIPHMNRINSQSQSQPQSPSPAQTPSSATSSTRPASNRPPSITNLIPTRPAPLSPVSNPASRTVSRRGSRALSTGSSTHSTQRSPSNKNSTSSLRKVFANDGAGGVVRVSASRRQSTLAISFTAPTAPDGDEDEGRDCTVQEAEQPGFDGTMVAPASRAPAATTSDPKPQEPAAPARKILDPLSAMNPPKANSKTATPADSDTNSNNAPLRRNFSSTSASTSGASTTSSSSNILLRHANELEAAYGIFHSQPSSSSPATTTTTTNTSTITTRLARSSSGASGTHTPLFSTRPRSIIQSLHGNRTRTMADDINGNDSSNLTTDTDSPSAVEEEANLHETVTNQVPTKEGAEVECMNVEWAKAHLIIVRDWAFEEGDSRFGNVPVEALLSILKPLKAESPVETKKASRGRGRGWGGNGYIGGYGGGRAPHYGSGAQYGGRWGDDHFDEDDFDDGEEGEEDEDDDGWGFPMGTVSGGPAPLGTTLLGGKRSRRELKNRVRAWNGLGGSKSVGGRLVSEESSEAEGESSGFYEEEDGGGAQGRGNHEVDGDGEDDDDDGWDGEVQTPSKAFNSFIGDAGYPPPPLQPAVSRLVDGAVHGDVDGVDADHEDDEDEGDSTDYDDTTTDQRARDDGEDNDDDVKPGLYRVVFSFDAEGENEMSIVEGQILRVLGKGGEGWAIAAKTRTDGAKGGRAADGDGDEHGLVPLGYLELHVLDE